MKTFYLLSLLVVTGIILYMIGNMFIGYGRIIENIENNYVGDETNLVYVSDGSNTIFSNNDYQYNITKSQIPGILERIQTVYPKARIANQTDIQKLVDSNISFCFCGWGLKENSKTDLTTFFPSNSKTNCNCGCGKQEVINCGDNGPTWNGGKAGIYMIINDAYTQIKSKLDKVNISSVITAQYSDNGPVPIYGTSEEKQVYQNCYKD